MIKKLTEYLDYDLFAEVALVLFAIVFIAIVIRTLLTRTEKTREQANLVFDEDEEGVGSQMANRPQQPSMDQK